MKGKNDLQKKRWNFDKRVLPLPVGIALGTAIGIATDHLALWLSLGVALGAGYDASVCCRRAIAKKEDNK